MEGDIEGFSGISCDVVYGIINDERVHRSYGVGRWFKCGDIYIFI
jgi:hypothetical protein